MVYNYPLIMCSASAGPPDGLQGKGWDEGDRAQSLIAKVEKAGFTSRVAIYAFTHENLIPFKLHAPDIHTCLLYAAVCMGLCRNMQEGHLSDALHADLITTPRTACRTAL